MDQASVRENTTSGEIGETEKRPDGVDTSQGTPRSHKEPDAETGQITPKGTRAKLGTKRERLAILMSEIKNCQTAGIIIKVGPSKTQPHRILIAVYEATICPRCNGFLSIDEAGMVKCQTPKCELVGVEYMPDELQERDNG